jgi:hypothetical protein
MAESLHRDDTTGKRVRYTASEPGKMKKKGKRRLDRAKLAATLIDPDTAEIKCDSVSFLDPYGAYKSMPEYDKIRPHYFARSPQSEIWVSWDDLPDEVACRLWRRHNDSDAALRDPFSCFASFMHSPLFEPSHVWLRNLICYVVIVCFAPIMGRENLLNFMYGRENEARS